MQETKLNFNQNVIRLCLFKVALFFSVFAFSGFNEKIQNSFQESTKTELVQSRNFKSVFSLNSFTNKHLTTPFSEFNLEIKPYHSYALLYFKKNVIIKHKVALKKTLSYDFFSIKLPIKTSLSSSSDETPLSTIV